MNAFIRELRAFVQDLQKIVDDVRTAIDALKAAYKWVTNPGGDNLTDAERAAAGEGAKGQSEVKRSVPESKIRIGDSKIRYFREDGSEVITGKPVDDSGGTDGGLSDDAWQFKLQQAAENFARATGGEGSKAAQKITEDNSVANDNRDQSVTSSVVVNQTVNGPTAAPGAAARATGNAVNSAVQQQSRIVSQPSTSGNGPQ